MITDPLTSKEKELLEILTHRNKIFKSCNAQLNHVYCDLDKYDLVKETFIIIARIYLEGIPDKNQIYDEYTHLVSKKEIEEFIRAKTESYYDNFLDKDVFKANIKVELESLANIFHQIEEIKSGATKRFIEIEKTAETYLEVCDLHDYVKTSQEFLKRILLQIKNSDDAYKSAAFKIILSRYNEIQRKTYVDKKKHQLIRMEPFIEDNFFKDSRFASGPVSYCLVEFLTNTEYSGKKRIAICKDCKCFFGKLKVNPSQKYCPICSKKNHTPKDIQAKRTKTSRAAKKKREDKEKRKELFEQKYKQFIKDKYPQKQAEELAKQYVIEQMP